MNTIRLMITALMAAGAIACFAEPAVESSTNATKPEAPKAGNGPRRPRMEQRSREARPARPEGENRRREMWVGEGRDGLVGQSMMLRMLDRPETAARLGILPDVRDKILASFKAIDDDIAAKDPILAALEHARPPRGALAKPQTAKVIELQSHLTDEQIKKIDAVRAEEFRTRRMRQFRDGDASPGRKGENPPKRDAPPHDK